MKSILTAVALVVPISGCGADPKESFEDIVVLLQESISEVSKELIASDDRVLSKVIHVSKVTYDVTKTNSEVTPYSGILVYTVLCDAFEEIAGFEVTYKFAFKDGTWQHPQMYQKQLGYAEETEPIPRLPDYVYVPGEFPKIPDFDKHSANRLVTLRNISASKNRLFAVSKITVPVDKLFRDKAGIAQSSTP